MASDLSQQLLTQIRRSMETGVPIQRMKLKGDQLKRAEMCMEVYDRLATTPWLDVRTYLKNRYNRTYSELKNDVKLIDYIASFYEGGQRNISKMQVRHASRVLMKNGQETGNMKAMHDGASLLIKLDQLDQPDKPDEMSEDMAKMPIVVTTNVGDKFANKRGRSEEEMRRIRKKWGVTIDQWQAAMEDGDGIQEAEIVEETDAEAAEHEGTEELLLKQEADAEAKAELDNDEDDSDSDDEDDEDDDWDAEIDAIIAADEKAHEERMKKSK